MAGAIPSGSDSSGYSLDQFGVAGGSGLSTLQSRNQANVEASLRGGVQASPGWTGASGILFAGLDPTLPFPIALLKAVAEALLGVVITGISVIGDVLELLASFALNLFTNIGGIIDTLTGIVGATIADLSSWVYKLLTVNSPINAANIFGSVVNLITGIPIGALTGKQPNLLFPYGKFDADALASNPRWSIDTSTSRSGGDGSGSVKVVANGYPTALRSGRTTTDKIYVNEGQKFKATIYCKHTGYVGAGVAVKLQIVPFIEGRRQDYVDVYSYTPAAANVSWPGAELTGEYIVPDDVTEIQTRLYVSANASGGTFWFDDASLTQTGQVRVDWVEGLPGAVENIFGRFQTLINTVVRAFTGSEDLYHTMEDLLLALLNIPFGNVLGVAGPTNIGQTILDLIDAVLGGFVGLPGSGGGLADLFNVSKIVSSLASLGGYAWDILGLRNNTPIYTGLLATGKSNYPITGINTNLTAAQSASLIASFRIQESSPLGVVSWLGCGTDGLTAFYVNVWRIVATSGNYSLVHHSPNILSAITPGATPGWNFYELDPALPVVAGEEYAFELVPVGGNHTVRGMDLGDSIPDHPYANTVRFAASRNNTTSPATPPDLIAKTQVTRSNKIPWIELAIDTGNAPGYHDPITVYMTENGSVPIPFWATSIEVIALGGGGGGKAGATGGFYGEGGSPGRWVTAVWVRGVDFTNDDTVIDFVRGAGGAGGFFLNNGANGGSSTFTVHGTEKTCTAPGGAGGDTWRFGGKTLGIGAGNYTFNGETYIGGGDQNVYSSGGCSPGGGGAGGNWLTLTPGGAGGVGAGWLRFIQGDFSIEDDNSPPTPPSLTLEGTTYSSITVTASGSTD